MSSAERLAFQRMDREEAISIILKTIAPFQCEIPPEFFSDKCFLLAKGKFDQILMIKRDKMNNEVLAELGKIHLSPYSVGVPLLKRTRNNFVPTLFLGNILVNFCKNKIKVNRSEAQKITYGKPVSIDEEINFKEGIVVDEEGDFIAFCKVRRVKGKIPQREVLPVLDIGWYLREGG